MSAKSRGITPACRSKVAVVCVSFDVLDVPVEGGARAVSVVRLEQRVSPIPAARATV